MQLDNPDFEISGSKYVSLANSCVYAWRRNNEWLYVGMSGNGLRRVFQHNIIGSVESIQKDDLISVWRFDDYWKANAKEKELISKHRPKHNPFHDRTLLQEIKCPRCKTVFKQKRWWQTYCSKECRYFTPRQMELG